MNWKNFFKKYWLALVTALVWVLDGIIWVNAGLQSGEWLDWGIALCAFAIAATYTILPFAAHLEERE